MALPVASDVEKPKTVSVPAAVFHAAGNDMAFDLGNHMACVVLRKLPRPTIQRIKQKSPGDVTMDTGAGSPIGSFEQIQQFVTQTTLEFKVSTQNVNIALAHCV